MRARAPGLAVTSTRRMQLAEGMKRVEEMLRKVFEAGRPVRQRQRDRVQDALDAESVSAVCCRWYKNLGKKYSQRKNEAKQRTLTGDNVHVAAELTGERYDSARNGTV